MDGMTAAWVAHRFFGDRAEYIASDDWKNLPPYVKSHPDLQNTEIYILDFSFDKEVLLELESKCKKLVILDHHVGAKENIEAVKNHVYGEGVSGAYLAWDYFYPDVQMPKYIQYVSDRDTWNKVKPDHEVVCAFMYRHEDLSFEKIEEDLHLLESEDGFDQAIKIGNILFEARLRMIKSYIDRAELINFEGYDVYTVNAPSEVKSEVGHNLANKSGTFAIVYYFENGKWKVSLRSVKDFDVSEIAKRHGGGGHKNAAAFAVNDINPILKIVNNNS